MTRIIIALSDARDASERAQQAARLASETGNRECLRRARVHALATRDAAQRALDALEAMA